MIFAGFEWYNRSTPELLGSYSDAPLDTGLRPVPEIDSNTVQRSYKFRFYPNAKQRKQLAIELGCARFVYNAALSARRDAWNWYGESHNYE